jgi:hypothetical protein
VIKMKETYECLLKNVNKEAIVELYFLNNTLLLKVKKICKENSYLVGIDKQMNEIYINLATVLGFNILKEWPSIEEKEIISQLEEEKDHNKLSNHPTKKINEITPPQQPFANKSNPSIHVDKEKQLLKNALLKRLTISNTNGNSSISNSGISYSKT